ncbi:hypothetical protein F7725_015210 [Dissostichus mawsoni]|uniref:Uncharacterized protein n=1 Tax=Dissostichus mawsoni TaxID=36200 RepID=A0A7J5YHS5_DISMA|nr:hypothetical protein F7725_015210 [Dissostichus mawsoni]
MEEKAKLQELGASHPLTEEQNVLFHRPIQHGSEHKRLQGFDHKALEDLLIVLSQTTRVSHTHKDMTAYRQQQLDDLPLEQLEPPQPGSHWQVLGAMQPGVINLIKGVGVRLLHRHRVTAREKERRESQWLQTLGSSRLREEVMHGRKQRARARVRVLWQSDDMAISRRAAPSHRRRHKRLTDTLTEAMATDGQTGTKHISTRSENRWKVYFYISGRTVMLHREMLDTRQHLLTQRYH